MTLDQYQLEKAVAILKAGGLVAFPTETVYGLGADARNQSAIQKVFHVKERPADHPLIVHIATIHQLNDWAVDVPDDALTLAQACWPGPLTLVLKKQHHVHKTLTGGQDTIALRIPNQPIALQLLQAFNGGIAAPSANKFTRVSPTTAPAVLEELGDQVDLVLDGGACEVGLESTILDLTHALPIILRVGAITKDDIAGILKKTVTVRSQDAPLVAPGSHHLHYALATETVLISSNDIPAFLEKAKAEQLPVGVMLYSHLESIKSNHPDVYYIKMSADPKQYAHELYRSLRALDAEHFKRIVIEAVPAGIEWDAIRDRLFKATGSKT